MLSQKADPDGLHHWVGFPGLTTATIDASLKNETANAVGSAKRRVGELATLLAVRPLSSEDWLYLATALAADGEPYESILAALKMSRLTGPNEGGVMWERGIFGLLEWELLPPDVRRSTARDLAEPLAAGIVTETGIRVAEHALSMNSMDARTEISGLLRKLGVSAGQVAQLGL